MLSRLIVSDTESMSDETGMQIDMLINLQTILTALWGFYLKDEGCGFVGVIDTSWRHSPGGSY